MLIVFSLSVCLSVSLSISLYVYSVYDFYNNNNCGMQQMLGYPRYVIIGTGRVY